MLKIKIVAFLLALGVMSASAVTTYRVTAVVAGTANGVNNSGDVTGQLSPNPNVYPPGGAYLYSKGVITNLGALPFPIRPGQFLITYSGQAVNDSDAVVGLMAEGPLFGGDNQENAFLWQKGTLTSIARGKKNTLVAIANGSSEGFSPSATAINKQGQAVGTTDAGFDFRSSVPLYSEPPRAFLYRNGTLINLGTLGGLASVAGGINNSGAIVGIAETTDTANEVFQAFLYQNGKMQPIGGALSAYFSPWAINDHGWITGSLSPAPLRFSPVGNNGGPITTPPGGNPYGTQIAVLYINGQITKLPSLPGFTGSEGLSINNSGVIVGNLFGPPPPSFFPYVGSGAFLYDGQMHNLNDLVGGGWQIISAGHISDTGFIAATGYLPGSTVTYGLLLTPASASKILP